MARTIVFAGGGTGGHLYPGIAVAEELVVGAANLNCLFIGSNRQVERSILEPTSFQSVSLPMDRNFSWRRQPIQFARSFVQSFRTARKLLRTENASVIVGLGGMSSVPTVLAAASLRVPVVLLEQNRIAGRATRLLSRVAQRICVSFQETLGLPSSASRKISVTGNPVRREILNQASARSCDQPDRHRTLLVLGGSQGARRLNTVVPTIAQLERQLFTGWRIIHQTGPQDADAVRERYWRQQTDAEVHAFIDDMSSVCRQADLVITRGGATTLAELSCLAIPMIIVPYPFAKDDHQTANARFFSERNAAALVPERENALFLADLRLQCRELILNAETRQSFGVSAGSLARPEAANSVMEQLAKCVGIKQFDS